MPFLSNTTCTVRQLCRILPAEATETAVISNLPGSSLLAWLLLKILDMNTECANKGDSMKKALLITLLVLTGIALAFPQPGYSWGHRWYGPGVVVGAGAGVVGAVVVGPGYGYYGPPVAYGYPPPAYGYPAPVYAYGYPYYGPRYYPGYRYYGYHGGRGYYGHRR
jgi:hypothetical protein